MNKKDYEDGDSILIEGSLYVIAKTVSGGFTLLEDKYFTPADAVEWDGKVL